jgi:hypothetical protein
MRVRTGAPRRILLSLLALVVVAASACSAVGPPSAATVGDTEISADELNGVLQTAESQRRDAFAAQGGGLIEDSAIASVPSSTTAIVLTALIYRESIGDEIDPTGALAETLDTEPVGYLENVLLSLGGAETLDQLEVSCALFTFTETPDQMAEVMAALPEPSVGGLQAVGASPLCIVRDDPRVPPEIVEQFWSAEIGALGAPLEFGAFDAVAFDGTQAPSAPGVIVIGVIARGPLLSPEISAVGQAANDLLQAWGQPAAAAGQAVVVDRLAEADVTVDPRYGTWNGVQVVDPHTSRLQDELADTPLTEEPLPEAPSPEAPSPEEPAEP